MDKELVEYIKKMASHETCDQYWSEELNIYEQCGGNIDDAYYAGEADGKVKFARTILSKLEQQQKENGN